MPKLPTFSLIYTSRRPHLIGPVVERWKSKAAKPDDLEFVVSIDGNDKDSLEFMASPTGQALGVTWVVQDQAPFNCVRGWNKGGEASTGLVLIAISDDFLCPAQWDARLLKLPVNWVDGEYVIHINDGFVQDLCTMPILTRKRYERFGYIFYPAYESLFCDTELTARAQQDGVMLEAMHIVFEHHHTDNKKRVKDQVDLVHASQARWNRGEILFNFRRSHGFPTDDGPKAKEFITVSTQAVDFAKKYAVYIQATKDDFCLLDVCLRAMEEGCSSFFFCVPDEYWSGKPTPLDEIAQVQVVADELIKRGATVNLTVINVAKYRVPGRSRIEVETYLRNDSLAMIQAAGFQHILIMDGDELWVPGLLRRIDAEVAAKRSTSVKCYMVPVVGLPGYPIQGARDTITVYIRADVRFYNCRSPCGLSTMMNFHGVVHFTACRKTMDEIVEKHRQSGHYDDPDYDMEGWIQKVLPTVKPGMRNIHMFKKWQIWPEARNWRAEELAYIPPSLYPYLGVDYVNHIPAVVLKSPEENPMQYVDQLARPVISTISVCQFSTSASLNTKKLASRRP